MKLFSLLALSTLAMASDELYFRTVNDGKSYNNTAVSCLVGQLDPRLTVVVETSKVDVEALDRLMDQLEEAEPAVAAAVTIQLINSEVPEYVELFKVNGESLQTLSRTDDKLRDTLVFWRIDNRCADEVATKVGSRFNPFPPDGIFWFSNMKYGLPTCTTSTELIIEEAVQQFENTLLDLFGIPEGELEPLPLNETACRVGNHASTNDCLRLTTLLEPKELYGQLISSYGSCRARAYLPKPFEGELISKAIYDTIDICMNLQGTAGFMDRIAPFYSESFLVCVAGPGGCTYGNN
ncbi:hypothetical protein CJU90_5309 [Yarrowia sp. C11]|nr:hypothetical protein CJU90_5309 [Yarrowia sp. C11]KAG5363912.1 hypothetical protein CKK34_2687 [Yarrowia sp. E02]